MTTTPKKVEMVAAVTTIGIAVGARPIQYQRRIVRDKRTGRLEEIDIHELPLADEGDEGQFFVFKQGEEVRADHPAVLQSPHAFSPVD